MAEQIVQTPSGGIQEDDRAQERFATPAVDIYATESGIEVVADLPGVAPDGLDIQVKDDRLTLEARTGQTVSLEPLYGEYQLTHYFRQFQLSEKVDTANISANLSHGVLTLKLPRLADPQPRKIPVAVG